MDQKLKGPEEVRDDTWKKCIRGTEYFKQLEKQKKEEKGEKRGCLRREESEGKGGYGERIR